MSLAERRIGNQPELQQHPNSIRFERASWEVVSRVDKATRASAEQASLAEIRFRIGKEDNGDERHDNPLQTGNPNGFEPFNSELDQDGNLFHNEYKGAYSGRMALNRRAVERVLRIAHLDGIVTLKNLPNVRQRSADGVNEDGSVSSGRNVLFNAKANKGAEENSFYEISSVSEGWTIGINDGRLVEELSTKERLGGKELQEKFINKFNELIKQGIVKAILAEKLSTAKDEMSFVGKVVATGSPILCSGIFTGVTWFFNHDPKVLYGIFSSGILLLNAFRNIVSTNFRKIEEDFFSRQNIPPPSPRKLDHVWEYFMPRVEIDKVIASLGYLYLNPKASKLVKFSEK